MGCRGPAGSLRFDGEDDHVTLEGLPELPASGWTVEAWIRPEDGEQQRPNIVARRSPAGGADTFTFRIRRDFGDVLEIGLASQGKTWGMSGEAAVPMGRWSHVAAVWDGGQAAMRLYIDGHLDTERGCPIPPARGGAPLWLGGDPLHGPTARPFAGDISELVIWDHARGAAQISQDARDELQGDATGLLLYWSARGGQGDGLTDRAPAGLHGLLGGGEPRHAPRWVRARPY